MRISNEVCLTSEQRKLLGVRCGDVVHVSMNGTPCATGTSMSDARYGRRPRGRCRATVFAAYAADVWLQNKADIVTLTWPKGGFGYVPLDAVSAISDEELVDVGEATGPVPWTWHDAVAAIRGLSRSIADNGTGDPAADASILYADPARAVESLYMGELGGALAFIEASIEDRAPSEEERDALEAIIVAIRAAGYPLPIDDTAARSVMRVERKTQKRRKGA